MTSINRTSNEILATIELHKEILGSGSKPNFIKLGMSELSTAKKVGVYALKILSCLTIIFAPLVFYGLNKNLRNRAYSMIEKDNCELIKQKIPEFDIDDQGKLASLYATKNLLVGKHLTPEQLDVIAELCEEKEDSTEKVDKADSKQVKNSSDVTGKEFKKTIFDELDEISKDEALRSIINKIDESTAERIGEREPDDISSLTHVTQSTANVAKSVLHTANSAASYLYGEMMSTAAGTYNGIKSWFNAPASEELDEATIEEIDTDETVSEELDEVTIEEIDTDETASEELDEVTIEEIDTDETASEELDEVTIEESNGVSLLTRATQSTANVAKSVLSSVSDAGSYIKSFFNASEVTVEEVDENEELDEVIIEEVDENEESDEAPEESKGVSLFARATQSTANVAKSALSSVSGAGSYIKSFFNAHREELSEASADDLEAVIENVEP